MIVLEELEKTLFFSGDFILELRHSIVIVGLLEFSLQVFDFSLDPQLFALSISDLLRLRAYKPTCLQLSLKSCGSLGLNPVELDLHLANHHHQFSLEFVVDPDDALGFRVVRV